MYCTILSNKDLSENLFVCTYHIISGQLTEVTAAIVKGSTDRVGCKEWVHTLTFGTEVHNNNFRRCGNFHACNKMFIITEYEYRQCLKK